MHAARTHIQAAIYVPDTSLSGACNAHKDLFRTRMNTRCHIRGSGVCAALTEREREKRKFLYATLKVTTFQCL